MNSNIGFRIKLKLEQHIELEKVIRDYSLLFGRYEIKVTKNICNKETLSRVVMLSRKYLDRNFSFHLAKNILNDNEELEKTICLFKILQENQYSGIFVTHIPYYIDSDAYKSILTYISNLVPLGSVLLIENELTHRNKEYIQKICNLFCWLSENGIENIKMCLDLGHLFYGCYTEKISQEEILCFLPQNIIKNIKQIHIHDFDRDSDHLQLGTGLLNHELCSAFIHRNNLDVPIIIEVTVKEPEQDGMLQCKIVERILYE